MKNVSIVISLSLLHPYELEISVYSIVPHLDAWAIVVVRVQYFPTVLLRMDSNLCHLFVKLDDH
jgi:hypothetical protein